MAVRVVAFAATGGVTVWDDDRNHGGALTFAEVRFGRNPDGSVDPDTIVLTCPVCGATSTWPVGGGASAAMAQMLFIRTVMRRAAALGIPAPNRAFDAIKARVKLRAEAQDGPGRFVLDTVVTEDDTVPTADSRASA